MAGPEEILKFWLDEVEPKDWYVASDQLDQTIRDRFLSTWEDGTAGENFGVGFNIIDAKIGNSFFDRVNVHSP